MEINLACSKPAQHRSAIAFCCDDAYLPYAAHAAGQIAQLHPDREFDICIVSAEPVTLPASLDELNLRLCSFDPDLIFSGFSTDRGRSSAMYMRLMLPQIFADDYDRILYLDADVHVESGDLSRLHEAMVSAHIVHFIGPSKPWRARPETLPPRFGRGLRHFCAAHFPERRFDIPDGPGPGSKLMTKMLVRHLINRNKMARYLARFPDDYTVIT
ncbi:glycosyl transferase family 8 [Thioclava sp. ES.031]|uniref:glycosyltransferase n=1 Tax=Thioclava sp. ES.031 TaxID=1798203 RepID=UPI000C00BB6B|nr:glycosyltransferase [Thioclava sp. ES.031]PFG65187.1 glycosyl transferase family 8 [Thioclava sp. ES.031]